MINTELEGIIIVYVGKGEYVSKTKPILRTVWKNGEKGLTVSWDLKSSVNGSW